MSTRYAAKKTTSSTLAISLGWKFTGPMLHPQPRAVDRLPDAGQRAAAAARRRRAAGTCTVALERAHVAHDDQRERRTRDADRHPHRLRRAREVAVEAGDHDEADAVQQRAIGSSVPSARGREAADREVRDDVEAEHREQEHLEVGRELRAGRRGATSDVAADGHDDGEEAERELGLRRRRAVARLHGRGCRGLGGGSASWSSAAVVVRRRASWWSWSSWSGACRRLTNATASALRRERLALELSTCAGRGRASARRASTRCAARRSGSSPSTPPGTPL